MACRSIYFLWKSAKSGGTSLEFGTDDIPFSMGEGVSKNNGMVCVFL